MDQLAAGRRLRRHYLPIEKVDPGMILGAATSIGERDGVCFVLSAGHALSEQDLHQLAEMHADLVCVVLPDERGDAEIAAASARAVARVLDIFDGADLSQPALLALFERVLAYRSKSSW